VEKTLYEFMLIANSKTVFYFQKNYPPTRPHIRVPLKILSAPPGKGLFFVQNLITSLLTSKVRK